MCPASCVGLIISMGLGRYGCILSCVCRAGDLVIEVSQEVWSNVFASGGLGGVYVVLDRG